MIGDSINFGETGNATNIGVLILLFCAYFLALEAAFLSIVGRTAARNQVNKRLWTDAAPAEQLQNLVTYMDGKSGAEELVAKLLADPALLSSLAATAKPADEGSAA